MNTASFIFMGIEALVLLVPLIAALIKIGGLKHMLEGHEKILSGFSEWKATVDTKVTQLELNDITQNNTLTEINKNITAISTKMDLVLDSKIKLEK